MKARDERDDYQDLVDTVPSAPAQEAVDRLEATVNRLTDLTATFHAEPCTPAAQERLAAAFRAEARAIVEESFLGVDIVQAALAILSFDEMRVRQQQRRAPGTVSFDSFDALIQDAIRDMRED